MMKLMKYLLIMMSVFILSACATTKSNEVLWVSGYKTEANAGAGKMQVLVVHRGDNLTEGNWETFYAPIDGFEFEEGFMKKIKVKTETLENVPADASSIKYTLVKELDKQIDRRTLAQGEWILNRINDNPINRSVKLPEMNINLTQMQVDGTGGCNSYSGKITKLTASTMEFGNLVSTQKACINDNIESAYFDALETATTYQVAENNLAFLDNEGNTVLSFLKKTTENQQLHDIWVATKILGNPINRMTPAPRLEVNLTEKRISGNDSCNEYSGSIQTVSDTQLVFGNIAATEKMCRNMDVANRFNQAINQVARYKLEGLTLTLLNEQGEEVLSFLKAD